MANKNTLRKRRAMEKSCKCGIAINSNNGGKWRGQPVPNKDEIVFAIRSQSRRLYGRSA